MLIEKEREKQNDNDVADVYDSIFLIFFYFSQPDREILCPLYRANASINANLY